MVSAVVVGIDLGRGRGGPPSGCVARVGDAGYALDAEQARDAALIGTVALGRGLPHRAVVVALATALQESKLRNLDYGDADSLGLFQQRTSQGWGTATQIRDPVHATNAFYDALVAVEGWQSLPVTVAAQRVQRSAFPDAYAAHEVEATALAAVVTGTTAAGLACTRTGAAPGSAFAVLAGLTAAFGGSAPRVETTVTGPLSLDVRVGAGSSGNATSAVWAVAGWLVAHAEDDRLGTVRVGHRQWSATTGSEPWTTVSADTGHAGLGVVVEAAG